MNGLRGRARGTEACLVTATCSGFMYVPVVWQRLLCDVRVSTYAADPVKEVASGYFADDSALRLAFKFELCRYYVCLRCVETMLAAGPVPVLIRPS